MKQAEQGFSDVARFVCADCFDDDAIKEFISDHVADATCSYCGRQSEDRMIAASMKDVMKLIIRSIRSEWGDPRDVGVLWDSREGGWQGNVMDSYDLLFDEMIVPSSNESLLKDIHEAISGMEWCKMSVLDLSESEVLKLSWNRFAETVKYHMRYVFHIFMGGDDVNHSPEIISPKSLLHELAKVINEVSLVRTLHPDTEIFRGRVSSSGEVYSTVAELGPPLRKNAKYSNRMSPAGIPMYYGALDQQTVIDEIVEVGRDVECTCSIALFRSLRSISVLDLTNIPNMPSLYDDSRRQQRQLIIFLSEFVSDIAKPIEKDGREHIEYVPTQVFTEFIRYMPSSSEGEQIMGIIYPSSRNQRGVSCVLFLQQTDCCDRANFQDCSEKWLVMESVSSTNIHRA